MPGTRAIARNTLSLTDSQQKTYTFPSHLSTQYEESNGNNLTNERISQRRSLEIARKVNVPSKNVSSGSTTSISQSQASRRSITNDGSAPRGRSNTDVQSAVSPSNGLKQQQQAMNGSGSDKSMGHHNQPHPQSPPPKPKCTLPTSISQPGYITSSKLFNMMGYGLQNQYLFMHAHYLYIIDCRSKEEFNQNHIITGKNLIYKSSLLYNSFFFVFFYVSIHLNTMFLIL